MMPGHIFNHSLSQGVFPDLLKIAEVNPILKKDDPHEISNYRPISLLPSISKVLEKIVHNRLHKFITKHKYSIQINMALEKITQQT